MQILLIPQDNKLREDTDYKELLKNDCVEGVYDINILQELVKGEYIIFLQEGCTFKIDTIAKLYDNAIKNEYDILVNRVNAKGMLNELIKEHNGFCRGWNEDSSLSSSYLLIHNMYYTYVLRKSVIDWTCINDVDIFVLNVTTAIIKAINSKSKLGCEKDVFTFVEDRKDIIREFEKIFSDSELALKVRDTFFGELINDLKSLEYVNNCIYNIMYFMMQLSEAVGENEDLYKCYKSDVLPRLMGAIDDADVIISNRHVMKIQKLWVLKNYVSKQAQENSTKLQDYVQTDCNKTTLYYFITDKSSVRLEYGVMDFCNSKYAFFVKCNDKLIKTKRVRTKKELCFLGHHFADETIYEVEIKLKADMNHLTPVMKDTSGEIRENKTSYYRYTPFSNEVPLYLHSNERIYHLDDNSDIVIESYNEAVYEQCENRLDEYLKNCGEQGELALMLRSQYRQMKSDDSRLWLVADRYDSGDDNGEAFFNYLKKNADEGIRPVFVVTHDSSAGKRVLDAGEIVEPFSNEHKLMFLLCEFTIGSQFNYLVTNPFFKDEIYYRDIIFDKKIVFLQHGVIMHDHSLGLNKYTRNLFGFVASTKAELKSFLNNNYYFPKKNLWLTGLPRYDLLYKDEKKCITIMPTWRVSNSKGINPNTNIWELDENFVYSDYYKFYNGLINDERLLDAAAKCGYTICYKPHPYVISGIDLFKHDERVRFFSVDDYYRDIFAQSDLLVTDYSSVHFDFAYLRKPLIYSQYDRDTFYNSGQMYSKSYFDFERDAFGEVETTLDGVVDRIIEYMENDCKLKPKYRKRINKTFAFNDRRCCERIYNKLIKCK